MLHSICSKVGAILDIFKKIWHGFLFDFMLISDHLGFAMKSGLVSLEIAYSLNKFK